MKKYICTSKCPANSKPCKFTEKDLKDADYIGVYVYPIGHCNKVKEEI